MARVFGLILLLVSSAVALAGGPYPGPNPLPNQSAALAQCQWWAATVSANGSNGACEFSAPAPGDLSGLYTGCPDSAHSGPVGGFYHEVLDGQVAAELFYCVALDCSVYDSGSGDQQWGAVYENDGVYCSGGCMSIFHMDSGVGSIQFPDGSGGSWGHFTGNGNRCNSAVDASLFKPAPPAPMVCDHGSVSCYNPDKGFCATTESGEQICEKVPGNGAGGCASGATGATCVGNNAPPPAPSDPPIPKGQAPGSSATATGTDSGGTVNNFTQNNYSGTSPGPGPSGTGSDPSGNAQSNQNGSGNSSGPSGTQGTDTSGKCPDGSVPTASGCSGTASDAGCDTPPQCYGDAVLCASFKEQVAIRCNTKAASGSSSGGIGTASDALAAAGVPADGGASSDPSPSGLVSSSDIGSDGFDTSGLGFSHTCPASPSFEVLGRSYTLDLTPFCNFASLLGWFVLLVAYLVGLRIVATGKA